MANTLVNKHGEKITKEALEGMVSQVNANYFPINIEHDPRQPILGRIAGAYLQEMGKGEYEVIGELEFFDENDTLASLTSTKTIAQSPFPKDKVLLHYDRNFDNPDDKENINNILNKLSGAGAPTLKNSIDPIGVLDIAALVAFGTISKGFLSKMGGDSWEYVRDNIKSIFSRKKDGEKEKILSLSLRVVKDNIEFDVEVLSTNPSIKDVDALFSEGLKELDELIPAFYQDQASIHKMVFEYNHEGMKIKYAVNKNCIPLNPEISLNREENP